MTQSIITELIAAFLLLIISLSWKNLIVPFFIETFGEQIKVYKLWKSNINFGSGNLHGLKLEIKKLGYNISGNIEFTTGRHAGKKYYVHGRFQSNILSFHYYPHDKHSTSQGTGTFKRLKDGELLSGILAYYSQDSDLVSSVKCEFHPIK